MKLFPIVTVLTALALIVCHRSEVGWISITSTPEDAEVYLDDSLTGEVTNCVLNEVPAGEHHLKLTLEEYEDWDSLVVVEEGDTTTANAGLDSIDTISEPTLLWKFEAGGNLTSPAIGFDGTVYLGEWGGGNGYFYAFTSTGTKKWEHNLGGWLGTPTVGPNGSIYIPADDGLYAFDPSGDVSWVFQTECRPRPPAIGLDGTIYFGACDVLYALDPDSTLKWKLSVKTRILSISIGEDGTIYLGTEMGFFPEGEGCYFYSVSPEGKVNWTYFFNDSDVYSSPGFGSDGTIYVIPNDPNLYAFSPEGDLLWNNSDVRSGYSAVVGVDGSIYTHGRDYSDDKRVCLRAISLTGSIKWSYFFEGDGMSGPEPIEPVIDSKGTIYIGSPNEYLYAINPDGSLRWRYKTEGRVYGSPAIGSDGTIYFITDSGILYALKTNSTGLANSSWPRSSHENQNTGNAAWPIR